MSDEFVFPVSNFNRPTIMIKINGEIVNAYSPSIQQSMSYSLKNNSSQGLSNTVIFKIPNEDGTTWKSYRRYATVEVYLDYLESNEYVADTVINSTDGGSREMQKVFTGYIESRKPISSNNGNEVEFTCKNTLFKYKRKTAIPHSYPGRFGEGLARLFDMNDVKDVSVDITDVREVVIQENVGNEEYIYDVVDRFRQKTAHYAYIDENDILYIKPFEDLITITGKQYWDFRYGENISNIQAPEEQDRVNKIRVYYGRLSSNKKPPAIVQDNDNINKFNGAIIEENIVRRDLSTYNDAYTFGANYLQEKTAQSNIISFDTFLFPYCKVGQLCKIFHPYLALEGHYTISNIKHNYDSATTTITGFAGIVDVLPDTLIKDRLKSVLQVSRNE